MSGRFRLLVQPEIAEVDFQVHRTLHHHSSPHFAFGKLFLEPVLGKASIVEVVADAGVADAVAAML